MTSGGQRFRNGWSYAERVRPGDFRDALTGGLRHHGRLAGLVNLSVEVRGAYDTEARQLLASLLPALGTLCDPTARSGDVHELPAGAGANLVTPQGVIDLPGREAVGVPADGEFGCLVRAFTASGGLRLRGAVAGGARLAPGGAAPMRHGVADRPLAVGPTRPSHSPCFCPRGPCTAMSSTCSASPAAPRAPRRRRSPCGTGR